MKLPELGWNRQIKLMAAATLFFSLGMGLQTAIFFNFLNWHKIDPGQLGLLESLRETPGFFSAALTALVAWLPEPIAAGLSVLVMALGYYGYHFVTSYSGIVVMSVLWSTGLHLWMPLSQAIIMDSSEKGKEGARMGELGAIAAIASLFGMAFAAFMGKGVERPDYLLLFTISALLVGFSSVFLFQIRLKKHLDRPKVAWSFDKKLSLYYWMSLLQGARKQVFITFAVYVLVKEYAQPMSTIALLMVINTFVTMLAQPVIGRLIDRLGERSALIISFGSLIPVFLGYAYSPNVYVLYALYIVDNALYPLSNALHTYVKREHPGVDLKTTYAMGVTMNHAAAVIVPLVGGLIWAKYGYRLPFLFGALLSLVAVFVAMKLRITWQDAARKAEVAPEEVPLK